MISTKQPANLTAECVHCEFRTYQESQPTWLRKESQEHAKMLTSSLHKNLVHKVLRRTSCYDKNPTLLLDSGTMQPYAYRRAQTRTPERWLGGPRLGPNNGWPLGRPPELAEVCSWCTWPSPRANIRSRYCCTYLFLWHTAHSIEYRIF